MSSYLSIFIVPKRKTDTEEKKYICLTSYSRNTPIYQYFNDVLNPEYAGNIQKYTTISMQDIRRVLEEFKSDIDKAKDTLSSYEKYISESPSLIETIINIKTDIEDLEYYQAKATFIEDILESIQYNNNEVIEEVCCNID